MISDIFFFTMRRLFILVVLLLVAAVEARRYTLTLSKESRKYIIISSFGLLQGGNISLHISKVQNESSFGNKVVFKFLCWYLRRKMEEHLDKRIVAVLYTGLHKKCRVLHPSQFGRVN